MDGVTAAFLDDDPEGPGRRSLDAKPEPGALRHESQGGLTVLVDRAFLRNWEGVREAFYFFARDVVRGHEFLDCFFCALFEGFHICDFCGWLMLLSLVFYRQVARMT